MIIESLSNNLIKHACSLKEKKYRECGEFLAEGVRLVFDINSFAAESITRIFMTEQAYAANKSTLPQDKISLVSDAVMKKLSDTQANQGIVAVIKKRNNLQITNNHILFLDRIRDPGNLGTIIRTAAAAGYSLMLNNCADPYCTKVVRSCMGGLFKTDFIQTDDSALSKLKTQGYTIVATAMDGNNLFKDKKHNPVCIVIGNEADGVSDKILALCDTIVTIPMQTTESLNAAVSAGIAMYYYKQ